MQLFTCPFCGARDEREFHFLAEAGKTRPDTTAEVSDSAWAAYLHARRNPKGASIEVWMHLPCRELFVMERDTVTMDILRTESLRGETP